MAIYRLEYRMEKLTEVLAQKMEMGGYAAYIWPAFALAAVVMVGMAWLSLRGLRRAQKTLTELQSSAHEA